MLLKKGTADRGSGRRRERGNDEKARSLLTRKNSR